jgi:hypothetical protein
MFYPDIFSRYARHFDEYLIMGWGIRVCWHIDGYFA